jgi:hypothetical protein
MVVREVLPPSLIIRLAKISPKRLLGTTFNDLTGLDRAIDGVSASTLTHLVPKNPFRSAILSPRMNTVWLGDPWSMEVPAFRSKLARVVSQPYLRAVELHSGICL